jgi:hypothetical protein
MGKVTDVPSLRQWRARVTGFKHKRTTERTDKTKKAAGMSSWRLRTENSLVFSIDLGFLELVGIVDVDRLPLGVEVDCANAAFAVAVAGSFRAAEG